MNWIIRGTKVLQGNIDKGENMKKALAIFVTVCLLASLFVSCDNTTKLDELVSTRFDAAGSRSLIVSNENFIGIDDYSTIKWQYTAVKVSDEAYNVGASSAWKTIPSNGSDEGKLDNTIEFSQGMWKFELRAVKVDTNGDIILDDDNNPVCVVYYGKTEAPVLLTKQEVGRVYNIPINLTAQPSGQKGYIVLNNISVKHTSGSIELYDAPNKVIIDEGKESKIVFTLGTSTEIESVITANDTALKTTGADGYQIDVGTHTVKVQKIGVYGEVLAEEEKTIEVYAGLKTTVSNWIVEITQAGQFAPVSVVSNDIELINAVNVIADKGTIVLKKDINLIDTPITIYGEKDIIIDTAGYTIKSIWTQPSASAAINIQSGAKLTLKGHGSIEAYAEHPDITWDINTGFPAYANNAITNSGTLIIDGPTIKVNTEGRGASYCIDSYAGSILTIKSGNIINNHNVAIRLYNSTAGEDNKVDVTINGGKIEGSRGIWIHLAGSDSDVAPKIDLNITGGEIRTNQSFENEDNNCLALYSYSFGNSFANTNVTINGGKFLGYVAFGGGYKGDRETVTINGGTFEAYNSDGTIDPDCVGRYISGGSWESIQY